MKRTFIVIFIIISAAFGSLAHQPERGYRGFLDWSNSLRSEKWIERHTATYIGASTSHGYQCNPWLYAGAGFDWEHNSYSGTNIFAAFAEGRTDLKFGKFTPFGDVRLGFSMTDGGGVYFSPTIGYRFNWGRKVGINFGVGLTVKGEKLDVYDLTYDNGFWNGTKIGTHRRAETFFSFRIGFDF